MGHFSPCNRTALNLDPRRRWLTRIISSDVCQDKESSTYHLCRFSISYSSAQLNTDLSLTQLQGFKFLLWKLWSPIDIHVLLKQDEIHIKNMKRTTALFTQVADFWESNNPPANVFALRGTVFQRATCIMALVYTLNYGNQVPSWQRTATTLCKSDSCWCRIRASLFGNCLLHSRQAIFFQSVSFSSSFSILSSKSSSLSLSPL